MMDQSNFQETMFCNFNHTAVLHLAKKLAGDETDTGKITQTVFAYVRDNIRFGFDLVQVKASQTLEKGYGVCWNKALLLAALLRANRVPARLAFNPVQREFMRPVLGDAYQTLPETINHCFAQVYLDSDWICVDATLDAATYETFFVPRDVAWGIDWNGTEDLRLYTESIVGPVESIEDIDAAIQQDVGNVMPPPAEAELFFGSVNQQMWQAVDV
jgi:transglutaminase-like putative cysteine protease